MHNSSIKFVRSENELRKTELFSMRNSWNANESDGKLTKSENTSNQTHVTGSMKCCLFHFRQTNDGDKAYKANTHCTAYICMNNSCGAPYGSLNQMRMDVCTFENSFWLKRCWLHFAQFPYFNRLNNRKLHALLPITSKYTQIRNAFLWHFLWMLLAISCTLSWRGRIKDIVCFFM